MKMNSLIRLIIMATASVLVSSTLALAFPAIATSAVNVRSGPGTSHARIDALSKGERVDASKCKSGWCYVKHTGRDGWVSSSYLSGTSNNSRNNNPDVNFSFGIGPDGPNFNFSIGDPPIRVPSGRACFYDGNNYNGKSICVGSGHVDGAISPPWNNTISSVRLSGGAHVTMCSTWFFGGLCHTFTRSSRSLGFLNNNTSSLKVD